MSLYDWSTGLPVAVLDVYFSIDDVGQISFRNQCKQDGGNYYTIRFAVITMYFHFALSDKKFHGVHMFA